MYVLVLPRILLNNMIWQLWKKIDISSTTQKLFILPK